MKKNYEHIHGDQISAGKVFLGILLAAAYGFTASVLLAPMSGRETRRRLKQFMR
jgi:gas vesicle protein